MPTAVVLLNILCEWLHRWIWNSSRTEWAQLYASVTTTGDTCCVDDILTYMLHVHLLSLQQYSWFCWNCHSWWLGR